MERGALEDCFSRLTERGVEPSGFIAVLPIYICVEVDRKKNKESRLKIDRKVSESTARKDS